MAPDGRFDIAYKRQFSGSDWDIQASPYDSTGKLLRGNITINNDSNLEGSPSIAMDNAGNAVVAYDEIVGGPEGIYANRLTAAGAVGPRITVQAGGGIGEIFPTVALAPTGGLFVVAYQNGNGVQLTEVGSDDSILATLDPIDGFAPAISIDGLGRYAVTYVRADGSTGGHDQIFSRRHFLS
jgi:hypothetical protein